MPYWSQIGKAKHLSPGAILWTQDDPSGYGAYLIKGVLGVERTNEGGDRIVFTELRPGAILGEMSCLDGKPHSATVKALSSSEIRHMSASELRKFLSENPDRLLALLQRQNQRIRKLSDQLVKVGTEPVLRRLSYWLCERQTHSVSTTHAELAAQLATTRESVSKALALLRRSGLVKSSRGQIQILDKQRLAETLVGDS